MEMEAITYLGKTNHRQRGVTFGIRQNDRLSHIYIIGKTGTGKTTLLRSMIEQDIRAGRGLALIDPHGDLCDAVVKLIPNQRHQDTIIIDPSDTKAPWGYNPIRYVGEQTRPLLASGLMDVFKKQWGESKAWGVRMEHILRNALLTLLDQPHADLSCLLRLFTDQSYQRQAIAKVTNKAVLSFWRKEWANYSKWTKTEATAPIFNKVGGFLSNPVVARVLLEGQKQVRLRSVLDQGQVLLVNLSKGKIGSDAASLLGGLLVTSIGLAAYSRASLPEPDRKPFSLYVDEFQNTVTLSVVEMASELRKYGLGLVLANQYLDQLKREIRDAVLGNAGTLICFRLGAHDARYMAQELSPAFSVHDIVNLPNFDICMRLMIDGVPSSPFSATTLAA